MGVRGEMEIIYREESLDGVEVVIIQYADKFEVMERPGPTCYGVEYDLWPQEFLFRDFDQFRSRETVKWDEVRQWTLRLALDEFYNRINQHGGGRTWSKS